jgi:hypothetical protein
MITMSSGIKVERSLAMVSMWLVSLVCFVESELVLDTTGQPLRFADKFLMRTYDSSSEGVTTVIYQDQDYIHLSMDSRNCSASYFGKKNPDSKAATVKTGNPVLLSMVNSTVPALKWWTCSSDGVFLSDGVTATLFTIVPSEGADDPRYVYTIVAAITTPSTICNQTVAGGNGKPCKTWQALGLTFSKGPKHWAYCGPNSEATKVVFIRK